MQKERESGGIDDRCHAEQNSQRYVWSGLVLSARVCGYTERRWVNGVEHCNAQHSIPQYSTVRGEEGGAKRGFPFFFSSFGK